MISVRSLARCSVPVAVILATGGCWASRNDVRVLQGDLNNVRAEVVRMDAARQAQLDRVLASVQVNNDSVRTLSARLARAQIDTRENFSAILTQLLTIQELAGQSQRLIQQARASIEEQNAKQVAAAAPAPGDSTGVAAGTPGPAQLLQMGRDQLLRGSAGTARAAFEQLVSTYPASDLAPDAQLQIGESFQVERNARAADSIYVVVSQKYPKSSQAPTALYKHGVYLLHTGHVADGRRALEQVVKNYPRSDEADLARDRLKSLK